MVIIEYRADVNKEFRAKLLCMWNCRLWLYQ